MYDADDLQVASKIRQLYYSLFLAYKTIDILKESRPLCTDRGCGSLALRLRHGVPGGSGHGPDGKVYAPRKGRDGEAEDRSPSGYAQCRRRKRRNAPSADPYCPAPRPFNMTLENALAASQDHSPEIRSKKKMVEGAKAKVKMAEKEYYPDFAIGASYFPRGGAFPDHVEPHRDGQPPHLSKTKQSQALAEATAGVLRRQSGSWRQRSSWFLEHKRRFLHAERRR